MLSLKNVLNSLKIIVLASILALGIGAVSAWVAPTEAPTGGNVATPVNTGTVTQVKEGGLWVKSFGVDTNAFIDKIKVGSTTTPSANLDIVGTLRYRDGNHGAKKVLTSDAFGNATWQSPAAASNFTFVSPDEVFHWLNGANSGSKSININTWKTTVLSAPSGSNVVYVRFYCGQVTAKVRYSIGGSNATSQDACNSGNNAPDVNDVFVPLNASNSFDVYFSYSPSQSSGEFKMTVLGYM